MRKTIIKGSEIVKQAKEAESKRKEIQDAINFCHGSFVEDSAPIKLLTESLNNIEEEISRIESTEYVVHSSFNFNSYQEVHTLRPLSKELERDNEETTS